MEQLAAGTTRTHRLHPAVKILVTLIYIVCVASLGRYNLAGLSVYLFYPVCMISMGEIPVNMIAGRAAAAIPFCLFAGISNLLFDTKTALVIAGVSISYGMLSMAALIVRSFLCVAAVLILTAVTPFSQITDCLRKAHIPEEIVTLLEMVYRFAAVLIGEAADIITAFRLRSCGRNWPAVGEFIPLVGQLFLRSADRAERVFQAMQCRGGGMRGMVREKRPFMPADLVFFAAAAGSSVLFRFVNVPLWIGSFFL